MPRRPRFVCEGMPHHVTQRGNFRQIVFESNKDFRTYSYLVAEYAVKYEIDILAYCFMTNHVHFIVVPKTKSWFSRFFNTVHMLYSRYKNMQQKRKGHLWQSRFFSSVMDERHLVYGVRYVEQNPMRAQMVCLPWDYVWSSAQEHIKQNTGYIIKTAPVSRVLNMANKKTWKEYLLEEDETKNELIRKKTLKGYVLGNDEFIEGLEQKSGVSLKPRKSGPAPKS